MAAPVAHMRSRPAPSAGGDKALEALTQGYAGGGLGREEFESMRRTIIR